MRLYWSLIFARQLVLLREDSRKTEDKAVAKGKIKLNENIGNANEGKKILCKYANITGKTR